MIERTHAIVRFMNERISLEILERDGADLVVRAHADGDVVGQAHAIPQPSRPGDADVRLAVVDPIAHRTLAADLLDELRRAARAAGIDRLHGDIGVEDSAVQRYLIARGAACWLSATGVGFELSTSRRARTVPPVVARRRRLGRLQAAS
jgi:hypothetical protein